jgi:hypothetical protein
LALSSESTAHEVAQMVAAIENSPLATQSSNIFHLYNKSVNNNSTPFRVLELLQLHTHSMPQVGTPAHDRRVMPHNNM